MKRPGYREAVEWLAGNDDVFWLADEEPIASVCTCMVRDLYDVEMNKLQGDLRRAIQKVHPNHPVLRGSTGLLGDRH